MKKITSILLILLMIFSVNTNCFASENEDIEDGIMPRWAYIDMISTTVRIEDSYAICNSILGTITTDFTLEITTELQKKNASGTFVVKKTWTDYSYPEENDDNTYLRAINKKYVTSGTFRTYVEFRVYKGSRSEVEYLYSEKVSF